MTIVQIVRSPAGGIRRHVMDVIRHFLSKGHRVVLITDVLGADQTFKSQTDEDWFKDVKLINLPIARSPHFSDFKNLWQLFKILRPIKPSVVHGHGAKGGIYARILGLRRSIYSPHGGSLHGNYGALKNYFYLLTEKLLLPITGKVVVESRYTYQQFRKLVSEGFGRVCINFNGTVFPQVKPEKPEIRYQVAALGLLRELKGFDLLVRAAEELKQEIPALKIRISGDGEERAHLERLIEGLDVKDIVTLTGQLESPNDTYEWADIVVVPSRFESFGLVALEAMAAGTPVIAAYTGGLMELVEHGETGRIFTRDSSSDLAEMLRVSFKNWALTKNMSQKAFEVAKSKYTMEHMLSGLEKIYSQVGR